MVCWLFPWQLNVEHKQCQSHVRTYVERWTRLQLYRQSPSCLEFSNEMWTHVTTSLGSPTQTSNRVRGRQGTGLDICAVYSVSMTISVIVLERIPKKFSHWNMKHLVGEPGKETNICLHVWVICTNDKTSASLVPSPPPNFPPPASLPQNKDIKSRSTKLLF